MLENESHKKLWINHNPKIINFEIFTLRKAKHINMLYLTIVKRVQIFSIFNLTSRLILAKNSPSREEKNKY